MSIKWPQVCQGLFPGHPSGPFLGLPGATSWIALRPLPRPKGLLPGFHGPRLGPPIAPSQFPLWLFSGPPWRTYTTPPGDPFQAPRRSTTRFPLALLPRPLWGILDRSRRRPRMACKGPKGCPGKSPWQAWEEGLGGLGR